MALTQVSSGGVKDDSIVNADIKSDAAIAGSKLAAATTSAAGSMSAADKTKLDGVATSATAVGGATGVDFNDDVRARWGTGNDFEVWHSSNNNTYLKNSTGELKLASDNIALLTTDQSEKHIQCTGNGAVELFYDNIKTFGTHGKGITVQGPEGDDADILLNADEGDDNADKWRVRADSVASGFYIQNYSSGSWEESIKAHGNGSVELFYDNAKRWETTSTGNTSAGNINVSAGHVYLDDVYKFKCGAGEDLNIYHDGSHSYIINTTNYLYYGATQHHFVNAANNEVQAKFLENGACELYNDNVKKLNTQQYGVDIANNLYVKGDEGGSASLFLMADEADDNSDIWRIVSNQDNNDLTFATNNTGSYVNKMTLTYAGNLGIDNEQTDLYAQTSAKNGFWYQADKGSLSIATSRDHNWSSMYVNKTGTSSGSDDRFVQFGWESSVKGKITCNGSNVSYQTSSDYRLKENIVDISDGITRLKQLKPRRFNWIADETNKVQDGFIAHEVSNLIPEAVSGAKDKVVTQAEFDISEEQAVGSPVYQAMDYGKLTPLLTAALKEAIAKIEILETKVAALEAT